MDTVLNRGKVTDHQLISTYIECSNKVRERTGLYMLSMAIRKIVFEEYCERHKN